jgi:hypothetical protein
MAATEQTDLWTWFGRVVAIIVLVFASIAYARQWSWLPLWLGCGISFVAVFGSAVTFGGWIRPRVDRAERKEGQDGGDA